MKIQQLLAILFISFLSLSLFSMASDRGTNSTTNGFVDVDVTDGGIPRHQEPTLPGNAEPGTGCNGCGGSTGGSGGGTSSGSSTGSSGSDSIWDDKVIIGECYYVSEVTEHPNGDIVVIYELGEYITCGEGDDPCLPLPCF